MLNQFFDSPLTILISVILLILSGIVARGTKPYSTDGTDVPPLTPSNAWNSVATAGAVGSFICIVLWFFI